MLSSSSAHLLKMCPASAVAPGMAHDESIRYAKDHMDPFWGKLDLSHAQLCPQHPTPLSEELIDACRAVSPETAFRLHASVRVTDAGPHAIWDASNAHNPAARAYWRRVGELSAYAGASVYSLHSGRRRNSGLEGMYSNVRALEDLLQMRVAVEGLYPDDNDTWLVSSWGEYAWLLDSGLDFAVDLSHLNILSHRLGQVQFGLLEEMLSSEKCLEIHVSGNDGQDDSHHVLKSDPWWLSYLRNAHREAVFFTEGCMKKPKIVTT